MAEPKTKDMLAVLDNLQIDSSALILLSDRSVSVEKSARNIPDVKTLHARCLNVIDILNYDTLVLPVQSLAVIEEILG